MTTPPPALLEDLLTSFRLELDATGKAARTVTLYCQSVEMFARWLADQDRPEDTSSLTRAAVRAWLAELRETRAASTVRLRHKALQRFTRWAVAEGELDADPLEGLQAPQVKATPVPLLTDDQVTALLRSCGADFTGRRDEAVMRLLLDCGLRVSELVGLTLDAVDLRDRSAIVTGKGSKVRAVYFGTRTGRALDRYERARRRHPYAYTQALFLGKRGPLTVDGVRKLLQHRGRAAGVPGVHPHKFRHTFAHRWLAEGGAETDLMRLAGWSTRQMLERYGASGADARAREAARRMSLGDRF